MINPIFPGGRRKVPAVLKNCLPNWKYKHDYFQILWLFRIFIHLKNGANFEKIILVLFKLLMIFQHLVTSFCLTFENTRKRQQKRERQPSRFYGSLAAVSSAFEKKYTTYNPFSCDCLILINSNSIWASIQILLF